MYSPHDAFGLVRALWLRLRVGDRDFLRARIESLDSQRLLQLAGFEHLLHDVAAAHEFAIHVQLRDRRPARELLDALSHVGIREHVEGLVGAGKTIEHAHHTRRETALGLLPVPPS